MQIYTDGSCNDRDKIGGWAFVVVENDKEVFRKSGQISCSSAISAELAAITESLSSVTAKKTKFTVFTDHKQIVSIVRENRLNSWCKNGLNAIPDAAKKDYVFWRILGDIIKKFDVELRLIKDKKHNRWHNICHKSAKNKMKMEDADFWNVW